MSKRNEGEWLVSLFCLRRMGEYFHRPRAKMEILDNGSIRGRQNGNPGEKPRNGSIAVNAIDHLGGEVMKVFLVNR